MVDQDKKILDAVHGVDKRVVKLEQQLKETVNIQFANLYTRVAKVETDVEELKLKPGGLWDKVVTAILTGIIGGLVIYVMTHIGL